MKEINLENKYLWSLPLINIVLYLLIWGSITGFYTVMSILVVIIICSKIFKINIELGNIAGRRLVIITFILTVAVIVFALWDKSIQAGQVMNFVLSCLPVCFFPLLFRDLWRYDKNNNIDLPKLRKPTPFSKKPKERPNLSKNRWSLMMFSYPISFSALNAIYPRAIYALSVWISLLYIIPNEFPRYIYILLVLSGIVSLIYFKTAKSRTLMEWVIYLVSGIVFAIGMFALLSVFQMMLTKMNYNWMLKNLNNGWFNNTYSSTQIGKEDGDFDDGQSLLLRTIWSNRNTDLLPASYFNLFTENNWSVSANFVSGETLEVNNGTVTLPNINNVPLLQLKYFDPVKDNKNDKIDFAKSKVPLENKNIETLKKEDTDNRIIIIGQLLKNQRGLTAIPMPTDSKYIIGEYGNGRFSKYSNGSVVFSKNSGLVNWQIIYDKRKYLGLHEPVSYDLSYPKKYNQDFEKIKIESGINNNDEPNVIAAKLQMFFQKNYKYTLDLKNKNGKPRTLDDFMNNDRRGHCEYFASTTTLLMRYLGIPTRYTIGFLVNEEHPEEQKDMYWIRKKDAHAWATYWDGKGWKNIDTTPYSSAEWEKPWYFKISNSFNHFQYVIDNIDFETIKDFFDIKIISIIIIILGTGYIVIRKRRINNSKKSNKYYITYIEGKNEERLRKEFKDTLVKYPKTLGEPWLRWAKRTKNEEIIKKVKEYYNKIY